MGLFETLENLDRKIFLSLNRHHTPQFDYMMRWVTNEYFWIPFYLVLVGLIIFYFRKQSWMLILFSALLITASDQISVLIKNLVGRYRPCHNAEIMNQIHLVCGCGGQFGFVSSHACNTFALAAFITLLLSKKYEYFGWIIFSWAALVSYSRIYVGVHYPADIIGGSLVGVAIGFIVYKYYLRILKKVYPDLQ